MSQSRIHSAAETAANIAIGYAIAMTAQILIFPAFGINIPLGHNLAIGACFTVVSLVRQYVIRRIANRWNAR